MTLSSGFHTLFLLHTYHSPPPFPPPLDLQEQQRRHNDRLGLDSLLIKPIQRMSMFKLLLSDLQKTAKKADMPTPTLDRAVLITQDIPKRANDAMTLSSIFGYEGNLHNHGQLVLQVKQLGGRWPGGCSYIRWMYIYSVNDVYITMVTINIFYKNFVL